MRFIRRLIWDPGNVGHIARHRVSPEEVEQVCQGAHVVRAAYAGRIILIGQSDAGRVLAVVLEPTESGVYYVVTARPASRRERTIYRSEWEEEK